MNLLDVVEEDFTCKELITIPELMKRFREDPPQSIGQTTNEATGKVINHPKIVAIDTESEHFHWPKGKVNCFCFTISWSKEHTYYIAIDPKDPASELAAAEALAEIYAYGGLVIMHNAKYDQHVINKINRRVGRVFDPRWAAIHCTMLMSHVLDENTHNGLKENCDELKISYDEEQDASELKKQIEGWIADQYEFTGVEPTYADVPKYLMVPYAVQDAYLTYELFIKFYWDMWNDPKREDLIKIYNLERALTPVLYEAEERGVRVDMDFVIEQIAEFTPMVNVMIEECRTMAEMVEFNPLSVDDVAVFLKKFGLFNAKTMMNPKTKKVNLPEWALEQVDHPIAQKVLKCRLYTKLLSAYFGAICEFERKESETTSVVSCNFRQIGARTGRMSISEPALQTIPKEKGNVRGAFIARDGCKLIFSDYASQELRILAHYTLKHDPTIAEAVIHGDLHQESADALNVERGKAKAFNFAIVYGAGQQKLADLLGLELAEAKRRLKDFHARFPGINWLKYLGERMMEQRGYVKTAYGRRHRLVRYYEKDGVTPKLTPWGKEQTNGYKASNSLIQGTAADMAKTSMVKIANEFKVKGMQSMIILQVHDEIIVEAPDAEVEAAKEIVERCMTDCPEILVPMGVETNIATRWSEAKE